VYQPVALWLVWKGNCLGTKEQRLDPRHREGGGGGNEAAFEQGEEGREGLPSRWRASSKILPSASKGRKEIYTMAVGEEREAEGKGFTGGKGNDGLPQSRGSSKATRKKSKSTIHFVRKRGKRRDLFFWGGKGEKEQTSI